MVYTLHDINVGMAFIRCNTCTCNLLPRLLFQLYVYIYMCSDTKITEEYTDLLSSHTTYNIDIDSPLVYYIINKM